MSSDGLYFLWVVLDFPVRGTTYMIEWKFALAFDPCCGPWWGNSLWLRVNTLQRTLHLHYIKRPKTGTEDFRSKIFTILLVLFWFSYYTVQNTTSERHLKYSSLTNQTTCFNHSITGLVRNLDLDCMCYYNLLCTHVHSLEINAFDSVSMIALHLRSSKKYFPFPSHFFAQIVIT